MLKTSLILAAAVVGAIAGAEAAQPSAATHEVVISDFAFNPPHVTVSQGDTVTWVNRDVVRHNATASDKGWTSGTLRSGASGSITANTVGTFTYICTRHPSMTGTLVVEGRK